MGKLKQTGLGDTSGLKSAPKAPPQQPTPQKQPPRTDPDLVTINIKIPKPAKQWLAEFSQQVRDNNQTAVPPKERVYPQHLIGVAIELLQNSDVDWSQIRNVDELRDQLKI